MPASDAAAAAAPAIEPAAARRPRPRRVVLIFGRLSSDGRRLAQSAGEEFARKHTTPQSDSVALVNALITIVNGLKADTGRKTVLLFSEGFAVPRATSTSSPTCRAGPTAPT